MTDIVERLRQVVQCHGDTYSSMEVVGMVAQAADEIERLRADIDAITAHRSKSYSNMLAEIEQLQSDLIAANIRAGKYSAGCEQCEPSRAEIEHLRTLLVAARKHIDPGK